MKTKFDFNLLKDHYAFAYDMDTDRMKKVFGEKNYTYGYKLIDEVVEETGLMVKVEESTFVAKKDISQSDFYDVVKSLYDELPWYYYCCNGNIGLKTIEACDFQKAYGKESDKDNYDFSQPYRIKKEENKEEHEAYQVSIDDDFDMDR